jgi:hypothetical protein
LPADFEVALQGVDTRLKALQPGTTLGDLAYSSATANTSTRLPIGTTGQVLAVSGGVPAWTTSTDIVGANPNLVINGNFTVNQRSYVSAANLASGSYGFDRWKSNFTNTTLTYTSAPTGQSVTINSGGGLQQIVEQANVPAGTYVLSFTGTATGRIYNSGATAPSYAASPITFTADGSANVVVEFTASGATKTLSKVKLELASTPTAFCFSGGTIQSELANCQRYYWRNTAGDSSTHFSAAMGASSTTEVDLIMLFPVTMRIRPTSLDYSLILTYDGTNTYSSGTFALITGRSGVNTATVRYTHGSAALTQYRPYQIAANSNSNAYIGFSAEL